MAFDGNIINRNLKIQDDEYFYMNVPISNCIVSASVPHL